MRTISGNVDSSEPISLSRAASILSNFVSTDHGASHAVRAYLRRASASFDELVLLHKELKHSAKSGTQLERNQSEVTSLAQEPNGLVGEEGEEQKPEKKKRKEKIGSSVIGQDLRHEGEECLGVESGKKKHKQKKEKGVIGDVVDKGGEIGVRAEEKVEIEEEKGKKRKSSEVEDGAKDGSEERPSKKKKRRAES